MPTSGLCRGVVGVSRLPARRQPGGQSCWAEKRHLRHVANCVAEIAPAAEAEETGPGHSLMMAGSDCGCQRRARARLALISSPQRQAGRNRHAGNGIRHAGGADASFRVVALTPSYIGNVSANAIPAGLSRQQGPAARTRPAGHGEIRPARRERRALTALTTGRAAAA